MCRLTVLGCATLTSRARPAEVSQNPPPPPRPPSLRSTSQCLSSLHIATLRFSFTFAAVTIYAGECSTSSTVSVNSSVRHVCLHLGGNNKSVRKSSRSFLNIFRTSLVRLSELLFEQQSVRLHVIRTANRQSDSCKLCSRVLSMIEKIPNSSDQFKKFVADVRWSDLLIRLST